MTATIGIVGAGIFGRLIAWRCAEAGMSVTVFERDEHAAAKSASAVAAGMLAPVCEHLGAPAMIKEWGREGLAWWRQWSKVVGVPELVTQEGTIVIAPRHARAELQQFRQELLAHACVDEFQDLSQAALRALEPELAEDFLDGLFIPEEAHLEPRTVLAALHETSLRHGVTWNFGCDVQHIAAHAITSRAGRQHFDWVIDARGWGAKADLPQIMPVRGEILCLETRDVRLKRPVRVLHPRHAIYIVPRPGHRFVVGASCLPCDDVSPISVLSALEFLSVAYHAFPAFAEARIVETATAVRPTFADHRPMVMAQAGLIRVNGAYRHGFLVGPKLAELVCAQILGGAHATDD